MITTIPEKEHEIYNWLVSEPRIIELMPLFQDYDMIAKLHVENHEQLEKIVETKIRVLDGILDAEIVR